MKIQEIKKKYDGKRIDEIEKGIKTNNELSLESRKTAIFALRYLEITGRYKENPIYRKSNFKNYLMDYYCIRENTYRESFRAFDKFEEPTKKYGVGLVSKVFRQCGIKKERQVIDEIQKADKALKIPIQAAKIEIIIQKYAKPTLPAKIGYKTLYVAEVKQHQITKDRYAETMQELKAARKQIEKLKATVLELRPLRDMREAIKPFMIPEQGIEQRAS